MLTLVNSEPADMETRGGRRAWRGDHDAQRTHPPHSQEPLVAWADDPHHTTPQCGNAADCSNTHNRIKNAEHSQVTMRFQVPRTVAVRCLPLFQALPHPQSTYFPSRYAGTLHSLRRPGIRPTSCREVGTGSAARSAECAESVDYLN